MPGVVFSAIPIPGVAAGTFSRTRQLNEAATGRRTVMRPWTIPILGAVALSLALPSNAEARLRFGPAAVLGVLAAGAMFGGFRHLSRHHRHGATHSSVGRRSARVARIERWRTAVGAPRPAARTPAEPRAAVPPERTAPVSPEQAGATSPERTAAIFWPDAAAD